MRSLWSREPTLILNAVSAGLALGIGFGLNVTTQQMALTMAFVTTVIALLNRSQVTSPASLEALKPQDLSKAQSTSEPVKSVVKKLP